MGNEKVLVVEDNIIIAITIKSLLQKRGFHVVGTVTSAKDAIDAAQKALPDLVLMDIVLNGRMDGIQAAEKITKRRDIPILFITSQNDSKTRDRLKNVKHVGILNKPFFENQLILLVEKALSGNGKHVENVKVNCVG